MYQPTLLFAIFFIALILFMWGIWRYDIIALIALFAALLTGIIPYSHAFSGFSNPAVALVASIMILSKAISISGFFQSLISWFKRFSENIAMHISLFTVMGALLASFMSAIGALGILMPIAIQTSMDNKRSPSLVLMPLAFGAVLGELLTLISSPVSILISEYRQQIIGKPFNMFDFTPVGIVVALAGILFISLIGWRLLPDRGKSKKEEEGFQIPDYITEVKITHESPFVKKTIGEIEKNTEAEFNIIAVVHRGIKRFTFSKRDILRINDILIIEADHANLEKILNAGKLKLTSEKHLTSASLSSEETKLVEAVVAPNSNNIGQSAKMLRLRSRYSINLLAISRKGGEFRQNINDVRWQEGDVVLLQGNADTLQETIVSFGLVPLAEREIQIGLKKNDFLLIVIYLSAVIFAALHILPAAIAFTLAVLVLTVSNVIPYRLLYQSIDWSVIFLLGALIPLGEAMQSSGASAIITHQFIAICAHYPPVVALVLIMLLTMVISNLMNFIVAAVVMAPIAFHIANGLHINVDAFLMAIVISSVCAFLTPIAHKSNLIVFNPGRYKFYDYLRLGLPMELIVIASAVPALLWIWPLR